MRSSVSIVIPTHDRAHTIGRALNSILVQTNEHDEVIVVDDGSVDNTAEVLAGFGEQVRYIWQPRGGPGAARNRGVGESSHDLVAFLDSDDEWLPGRLDLQCALMDARPELVMSFADMRLLLVDGTILDSAIRRWQSGARPWQSEMNGPLTLSEITGRTTGGHEINVYVGDIYADMLNHCWIHCNTAVFRRSLAGEALRFPEGPTIYEDWECFANVARVGPVAFLECCVATQINHTQDRLTACDELTRPTARVRLLERVWGSDAQFLSTCGVAYRRVLDEQRTLMVEELLNAGRSAEARAELARVERASVRQKCLVALPGWASRSWTSTRTFRSLVRTRVVGVLPPSLVTALKSARQTRRRLSEGRYV